MIFRIFYLFLFLGVLACNPPLKLKDNQLSAAQMSAHELKSQALVVRIPTQSRKINFLKIDLQPLNKAGIELVKKC